MELIQIAAKVAETITADHKECVWILSAPSINETEMDAFQGAIWALAFFTEMTES